MLYETLSYDRAALSCSPDAVKWRYVGDASGKRCQTQDQWLTLTLNKLKATEALGLQFGMIDDWRVDDQHTNLQPSSLSSF